MKNKKNMSKKWFVKERKDWHNYNPICKMVCGG